MAYFPTSPIDGEPVTVNGILYTYNASKGAWTRAVSSINNLPDTFARFERVVPTMLGVYEISEGLTYEWADGIVKDVHHRRSMTPEERTAKQDAAKNAWQQNNGFASWTFNEDQCQFEAPVPYPADDKFYVWDEPTVAWVEFTINT